MVIPCRLVGLCATRPPLFRCSYTASLVYVSVPLRWIRGLADRPERRQDCPGIIVASPQN